MKYFECLSKRRCDVIDLPFKTLQGCFGVLCRHLASDCLLFYGFPPKDACVQYLLSATAYTRLVSVKRTHINFANSCASVVHTLASLLYPILQDR